MSGTVAADIPRSRRQFWLLLLAFAAIYLAFRLPWIRCDPGIQSVWEYGYNATDEGYYLSGGKEKFLWGHFVDMPRNEAFTYGFSSGTHWLSYLSHLFFGLSSWTWRIPFLGIYFLAWVAMFCNLARRVGSLAAFALCASVSCVPMVVAYERTASNDALIGALLVLAYVCATGRARWRVVCAGIVSGAIILVKPSVWVLLPIVAAGVAMEGELRSRARDVALFAVVAVASAFAWKLLAALAVAPDAAQAGVSIWEVVKKTTTHYPLPPLFDFASHFKGVSSFPRDPSIQLLGVTAPLVLSVPLAAAARNALAGRWNGHFILFLAMPAYVAAVSVMNTIYTHYFLPVVVMIPLLAAALSSELEQSSPDGRRLEWGRAGLPLLVVLVLCALGVLLVMSYSVAPATSQNFYSRIYNFPARNVWGMTWPMMAAFVAVAVAAIAALQGLKANVAKLAAWVFCSFVAASVVFAPLPAVQLSPYMKKLPGEYLAPMAVSLVVSALFLVAAFGLRGRIAWRRVVAVAIPACMLACYLATPNWRSSFAELVQSGTRRQEAVAKELAALLPEGAIVIGERSNQLLMSQPIRTATTFAANSDPIPVIRSILKAEPEAKLFAIADSQHAYNLQHYNEHAGEFRLDLLRELSLPSFASGNPAKVYFCRIVPIAPHPAGAPGLRANSASTVKGENQ